MKLLFKFGLSFALAVVAIVIGIMLGDYGPWYLSWVLGTGLMILVAAIGGVLFEAQEDEQARKPTPSGGGIRARGSR
jgi:cyd operon protein YbgT